MIKAIGTAARLGLEEHFDQRVFLDLHVKVKSEWRDDYAPARRHRSPGSLNLPFASSSRPHGPDRGNPC